MAEGIVSLCAQEKNTQCLICVTLAVICGTHSTGDESTSLNTSRLNGLENVNHTLCLQSLQLGVDTDESPCSTNTITEMERRGRKEIIVKAVCMKTWKIYVDELEE